MERAIDSHTVPPEVTGRGTETYCTCQLLVSKLIILCNSPKATDRSRTRPLRSICVSQTSVLQCRKSSPSIFSRIGFRARPTSPIERETYAGDGLDRHCELFCRVGWGLVGVERVCGIATSWLWSSLSHGPWHEVTPG